MTERRRRMMSARVAWPLILLLWPAVETKYTERYPYLYATPEDSNASFPVIEHMSPKHLGLDPDTDDRPDFLYESNQGYRIVEFYIHWCNTCKLYAPVYRSFAEKVRSVAVSQNIEVHVYAVNCSPNRKLCLDQQVKGYPKIRLYKPNSTEHHELKHHMQLRPHSVLNALGIDFDGAEDDWDAEAELNRGSSGQNNDSNDSFWRRLSALVVPQKEKIVRRTRGDLKADIHLSFDYAMRNDVFSTNQALSAVESRVLKSWLRLLMLTLPSPWEITGLLKELIDNFIYVAESEDYLVAVLDEYPPAAQSWSLSCSHGHPDEGYTCGLWELFHAVTVGVVDHNKAVFYPDDLLATESVARTIRDYVDNFFGCEICRKHFVTTFDACGHNRCTQLSQEVSADDESAWIQLPLWLHETHNAVNVRLVTEKAARENREVTNVDAARWPSRHECSLCRNDDGSWNPDVIFKYLRLEYGQRDAFTAELKRVLAEQDKEILVDHLPHRATLLTICIVVLGLCKVLRGSRRRKEKEA